ncbi:MAG: hypothetical protein ACLQPH_11530 [Acidimicrobiales bacterium]
MAASGTCRCRWCARPAPLRRLAACGAADLPVSGRAKAYAQRANLTVGDLPSGWASSGASATSVTPPTLPASEKQTVASVFSGIPGSCRSLDGVFTTTLLDAAPPGTVAQDRTGFHGTTPSGGRGADLVDGRVDGESGDLAGTFASYPTPTFVPCLQAFLGGGLAKVFKVSSVHVTVVRAAPPPVPARVSTTTMIDAQSGLETGSSVTTSVTGEVVLQSGKALAFVEAESPTALLPTGMLGTVDQAAAGVADRLVPPPT